MPGLGTCSAALFSLFGGELLGFEKDPKAVQVSAGGKFRVSIHSTVGVTGFLLGQLRDGDVFFRNRRSWQKSTSGARFAVKS